MIRPGEAVRCLEGKEKMHTRRIFKLELDVKHKHHRHLM